MVFVPGAPMVLPSCMRPAAGAVLLLIAGCSSQQPTSEQKEQMIDLHTEMALGYYRLGELARAEDQALKGLELAPRDEMLQLVLAWTLQRKGTTDDVRNAEVIFRRLEGSGDFRVVVGLAEALEQKGKAYDQAARRIRSGELETEAADPVARAEEYAKQARQAWEESVRRYEQTLGLHPQDKDALNGLQRVQALLGRYEQSLARSAELVELVSGEITFWEERLERPELSAPEEEHFRKLVENARGLLRASYLQQAAVLRQLGRREEELERLSQALELAPDRPDVLGRRAQVLMELGRYEDAVVDLDRFLSLTPEGFDHPDTKLAYELKASCEARIAGQ